MPQTKRDCSMDDFIQNTLKASLTQNGDRRAQASDNFLAILDRSFGRLAAKADPVEAAAIRQISHREAPIDRV